MSTNGEADKKVVQIRRTSRESSLFFIEEQKDGHVEGDKTQTVNGGVSCKVFVKL